MDPNFIVLEEGLAAALRAQAVEAALEWAAVDPEAVQLFSLFKEGELRRMLSSLVSRRLDAQPMLDHSTPLASSQKTGETSEVWFLKTWAAALDDWLGDQFRALAWTDSLKALSAVQAHNSDDKLEQARRQVLAHWEEIQSAHAAQNWDAALAALAQLRSAISSRGQKANWGSEDLIATREAMRALRDYYDADLKSLVGKGVAARWTLDEQVAHALPAMHLLFQKALQEYQLQKDERQALDFDDLEGGAARLLDERADVRERWQDEIRAVLVDEFQDTNARQRQIVYALTGFSADSTPSTADLFIVGDSKQSIYRFRGADVTVFREVQSDITAAEGLTLDLDLTFRAHKALLATTNALLSPILGETDDPARPYRTPFAPLRAYRQAPAAEAIGEPYVEFHLGLGDDAGSGRATAAAALADRLRELHAAEGFDWGAMALLFRASTAFGVYEDALERAGIPFVTVAGRGFYDRPEIRDLLNALAAIADPTDDLALAGLLRSPALGLGDADLYHLRFPEGSGDDQACPLWEALMATAAAEDTVFARARGFIAELHALSGRAPAAEVLKRFLDVTGYRAMLGAVLEGGRLRRNVDKLLADAHRSRMVGLGEFLEYVQTLRDVGVREGEAPVEAGGAVQLMTVHKAKGLEFPLVVIADAAYQHRGGAGAVLLDSDPSGLGLLLGLSDADGARPAAWRLASLTETAKEDAEDERLLYVAATRAKEKLLISGHAKLKKDGTLSLRGWLARLGDVMGLDVHPPPNAGSIACTLYPPRALVPSLFAAPIRLSVVPPVDIPDLVVPLTAAAETVDEKAREREADPPRRVWRIVPQTKRPSGPAWVVGKLVHEALRRWRFPNTDDFDVLLWPFALEAGLTDPAEILATIREVRRLLERFHVHPLRAEIEAAERYHEVPYALSAGSGIIDVLYRTGAGWTIADFKTDELRSEDDMRATIRQEEYDEQVRRYADAVSAQLGQRPRAFLVFLRVANEIKVLPATHQVR